MPVDQLNENEGMIKRWDEHAKTYDDESKQFSSAVTHFVDWELQKGYLPQNKEARGQGVGTAITLAPLLDARGLGFHISILQASHLDYNVYRRLGFQDFGKLNHYRWENETEQPDTGGDRT